ncbi:DUF1573 domain-containing protein [Calorimonas adulescens]|jgi:hypothetical protein|uniref:DUF1573 domain-containing protein n=1 Tax=Calorimonas adulescens TaxID=2606906 RepID=A0A5D8QEU2_9THEO|nr:DUF1573 domain-containing protein [Calorimonas adulescens]TZE82689.1 DUF1573 domain-containing protein [Calorimonas adulescens]
MKDIIVDDFQNTVNEVLFRHKSILDVLTKLQETDARIGRAVAKAVTVCGCIKIEAQKQEIPPDIDITEISNFTSSHLSGELCDECREVINQELQNHLFYLAALCNLLNINLYDNMLEEYDKLTTLGTFNML